MTRLCAILAALAMTVAMAGACDCAQPPPPKAALAAAGAVFSGKVVKIEEQGASRRVTIEVAKTWRDIKGKMTVVSTAKNGAACGFGFQEGKSYLIYASTQKDGTLHVSLCSRTKLLDKAEDDIKEIGEGKAVPEEKK